MKMSTSSVSHFILLSEATLVYQTGESRNFQLAPLCSLQQDFLPCGSKARDSGAPCDFHFMFQLPNVGIVTRQAV